MVFHATFNNDSVYRGDQVNWRGKPEYTVKTTDLPQLTDKLYHIMLWQLHTAMNRIRTHNGPGGSMSQVVGLPNNQYKHITNTAWVRARLCKLQKGCTRLAVASGKAYQLLAHCRWFSADAPASSTNKTGRHDIAEILLKVAISTKNQSINRTHNFSGDRH